jgi:hypothetical protein
MHTEVMSKASGWRQPIAGTKQSQTDPTEDFVLEILHE